MRARLLLSAVGTVLATAGLAGCGTAVVEPAAEATPALLLAHGIVMQSTPDAPVQLCVGPVLTSYPPQCGGPTLLGQFSWDDVHASQQGGVRWSESTYAAVGHYDRDADTFTLTRPLSTEPPEGVPVPTPAPLEFPQLCDDPFRGGDRSFAEDFTAQEELQQRLESLDGYVASWVSDGVNQFNVVVTADPEAAHASLREVWPGGLCVEQRDLPSAQEVAAAQSALSERADDIGLLTSMGRVDGGLEVEVVAADPETTSLIHEIVSPWLTPDQVQITAAMVQLEPPG